MAGRTTAPLEVVDYRRSPAVPGVEVLDARHSPREWRVIPDGYAVVVFKSWRGRACTRGQAHIGECGLAFCNTPGDLLIGTPLAGPGSFEVFQFQPHVLGEWLAEQQPGSVRPEWSRVMQPLSPSLRRLFADFFAAFGQPVSAMQIQSQLLELAEAMVGELIQGARQPLPVGPSIRGAARMRECLTEEGLNVDLETLAQHAGLSRFQALRAFKQRYGLPPHAYQICLRIRHARGLLRAGIPAADVAHRCGFADQSHFTRHFKRLNGVTPMQYARADSSALGLESGTYRIAPDSLELLTRSDR